jgi:hypothetical protein
MGHGRIDAHHLLGLQHQAPSVPFGSVAWLYADVQAKGFFLFKGPLPSSIYLYGQTRVPKPSQSIKE